MYEIISLIIKKKKVILFNIIWFWKLFGLELFNNIYNLIIVIRFV